MSRIASHAAVFALLLSPALPGCKKTPDEAQIATVIRKAIASVNDKKAGDVVADAADGFKGPRGADTSMCRRILAGYFLQQGWLTAFERDLAITVEGETAQAQLVVVLARGRQVEKLEDLVPTNGTVLRFELSLVRRGGDWKFSKAEYTEGLR